MGLMARRRRSHSLRLKTCAPSSNASSPAPISTSPRVRASSCATSSRRRSPGAGTGSRPTRSEPRCSSAIRTSTPRAIRWCGSRPGRLRRALEHYYLVPGLSDPVIIDVPKGAYVPHFTLRAVPRAEAVDPPDLCHPAAQGACRLAIPTSKLALDRPRRRGPGRRCHRSRLVGLSRSGSRSRWSRNRPRHRAARPWSSCPSPTWAKARKRRFTPRASPRRS